MPLCRVVAQVGVGNIKYVGGLRNAPSGRTRVPKLVYFWYLPHFDVGCKYMASDMDGIATTLKSRVWGFRKGAACLGSSQGGPCSPADSLPGTLGIPQDVAGRRRDLGVRGC